jgi:hypothetical protein
MDVQFIQFDSDDIAQTCLEVACDHFDAATLNPDALVYPRGLDEALALIGWQESPPGWLCEHTDGRRILAQAIGDPYAARRLNVLIQAGRLLQFPWETAPVPAERFAPLVKEVLAKLLDRSAT